MRALAVLIAAMLVSCASTKNSTPRNYEQASAEYERQMGYYNGCKEVSNPIPRGINKPLNEVWLTTKECFSLSSDNGDVVLMVGESGEVLEVFHKIQSPKNSCIASKLKSARFPKFNRAYYVSILN